MVVTNESKVTIVSFMQRGRPGIMTDLSDKHADKRKEEKEEKKGKWTSQAYETSSAAPRKKAVTDNFSIFTFLQKTIT